VARYGVAATPTAVFSGLAVGFLMVMLPLELLAQVGSEPLGGWLAVPLTRDVAPLLAAFLVAGRARSPSPPAADIPTRIAAVLPAATVSSAGLFVVILGSALLGGFGMASLRTGTPLSAQLLWVADAISVVDVLHAVGKTALFGVVVSSIRCYHSLIARTSAGVLRAVVAVLALNVVLSAPHYRGLL
jgi:ABC-type transporter Mla maintaining outer membrane lipid asymmetry permease subunit MlaE